MSTKTTFKRVALVAVGALTFGLLSAIPSNSAVIGTPTVTASNGTATLGKSDSTTAASIAVSFFTQNSSDSVVITLAAGAKPAGSFDSTMVRFFAMDTTAGTVETTLNYRETSTLLRGATETGVQFTQINSRSYDGSDSKTVARNYANSAGHSGETSRIGLIRSTGLGTAYGKFGVFLDSAATTRSTAGSFTIPYTVEFYSNGALDSTKSVSGTLSIVNSVDGTAAAGSVTASATSSAVLYGGSTFHVNNTVDSTLSYVATPATTANAVIRVTQKTAAGAASQESITVTIDKGNVGSASGTASGKSVIFEANSNGINDIYVFADGTSGVATITLKTTSVTFGNKTITWYAATVATITVTKLGNTLGSSSAAALLAVAKDASGNVSQADVFAVSADRNIIATTVTTGTTCSYDATYGGNVCNLSGATDGTTTITVWNTNSAATRTISSAATSFTVNTKSPVAIKIATDKTTYAPGEVAYVRVWGVDSAGNPVAPGTYTNLLATGGITSTAAMGNGSDTTTAVTFTTAFTTVAGNGFASAEGIKLYKVYMPYTGGEVTFKATGGTSLPATGQVEVSAKVTVTDNGAAALAAVTALASQVSAFITKINAQITTLTDLVMKIQKKVKA